MLKLPNNNIYLYFHKLKPSLKILSLMSSSLNMFNSLSHLKILKTLYQILIPLTQTQTQAQTQILLIMLILTI